MVDPGDGTPVQVVCGAPNARAGMIGVFAPAGTHHSRHRRRCWRRASSAASSRTACCSPSASSACPTTTTASSTCRPMRRSARSYAAYAGLDDPVIDVAVTPNRPDALGVAGIARDLAAAGVGKLIDAAGRAGRAATAACPVKVDARFRRHAVALPGLRRSGWCAASRTARRRTGCRSGCRAIGLRPINALVDITNFITYDRGRPLHVFDAAEGRRQPRRAARQVRRGDPGARRQDLRARSRHLRHRRRQRASSRSPASWAANDSGCDEDDHRRADRVGAVGAAQHRRRPAASSASIPTRATASSAASIRRSWCRAWSSRRRWSSTSAAASRATSSSPATCREPQDRRRLPGRRGEAPRRHRAAGRRDDAHPEALGFASTPASQRRDVHRHGAALAAGRRRSRPTSSRRSCASSASTRVPVAPLTREPGVAEAGADADPDAHAPRQARARRARPGRGGDVVVHRARRRRWPSAAARTRWCSPTRSPPTCRTCGRASSRA